LVARTDSGPPLRLAVAPVYRDTLRLGMVGIGAPLNAKGIAGELTPGTDVALIVGGALEGATFPDSLADEVRTGAARIAASSPQAPPQRHSFGGQAYLARTYDLATRGLPVRVVLFRRITDELRIAEGIKRSLGGIGALALALAVLLAAVVARIVARPAQALALASARLARGDYRAPLPRDSGDEIGQLARAFGEMRSAIAEREGRLRSAQAEMIHREKLAAMGRLVAQLSHEINNPIYNIQNCLEALERRGDPGDPNREFLTLAQEELARLASLTRQLLDQSRPLSDAAQPMSVNALVQRVLTLASPELEVRGIRAVTELAADHPEVVVHPEGIHQVLANLVNNACDAMPGGGTLRVVTRGDGDAVEVVVEDTGTGIAETDLPHIFEAFYTTKPGVTGLGLGLFVSEGIIRGHRGRLSVESRPGAGSRFTVRLPRETLDEGLAPEEVEDADVPAGAAAG
ncbi:MAG TPA: ATP-binding protein, partial [Longimicrobiaceae bacterium]|nr:ATP-binding protein [Longimicrobiaceae bacterium]